MCAITYSAPTFSLSLARGADINLALGNQCTTDYVYIPQGRGDTPAVTSDRRVAKCLSWLYITKSSMKRSLE